MVGPPIKDIGPLSFLSIYWPDFTKVSVDFPAKNDWFRGTIIIISDAV